jgi:hypothetical protein
MDEETILILEEEMPISIYREIASLISSTLKGYKHGCEPENFECSICNENSNSHTVILECDHMYHLLCIEHWISIRNECPCCRHVLPPTEKIQVEQLILDAKEELKKELEAIIRNTIKEWLN